MDKGQTFIKTITGWAAIAFSLLFVYGFLFWEGSVNFKEIQHIFYEAAVALFAVLLYMTNKQLKFALLSILLIINLAGDLLIVIPEMNIGIMSAAVVAIGLFIIKITLEWKKHRQFSAGANI